MKSHKWKFDERCFYNSEEMIVRGNTSFFHLARISNRKMASRFVDAGSVDNFTFEQENKNMVQKTPRDPKLLKYGF